MDSGVTFNILHNTTSIRDDPQSSEHGGRRVRDGLKGASDVHIRHFEDEAHRASIEPTLLVSQGEAHQT
mgnify:CR=1 FL=1